MIFDTDLLFCVCQEGFILKFQISKEVFCGLLCQNRHIDNHVVNVASYSKFILSFFHHLCDGVLIFHLVDFGYIYIYIYISQAWS